MTARLVSVNVGRPKQISVRKGRPTMSAIGKAPVEGRVRVEGVNLAGDDQADRTVHGGPDKAVYAYVAEDAAWWSERLERELPPGMFRENLTVEGVDVSGAVIGETWRLGTVELEVCQPRLPCFKLGLPSLPRRHDRGGRRRDPPRRERLGSRGGRPAAPLEARCVDAPTRRLIAHVPGYPSPP